MLTHQASMVLDIKSATCYLPSELFSTIPPPPPGMFSRLIFRAFQVILLYSGLLSFSTLKFMSSFKFFQCCLTPTFPPFLWNADVMICAFLQSSWFLGLHSLAVLYRLGSVYSSVFPFADGVPSLCWWAGPHLGLSFLSYFSALEFSFDFLYHTVFFSFFFLFFLTESLFILLNFSVFFLLHLCFKNLFFEALLFWLP